ncbi:WSC domain-containing protein [Bombardia bombarda]|uniref:WSC domain-containing protein n=1 Tax=Bombardia bombarda TaxID=252184 RepID=A0AA39WMF9_9PEZI|nr:WSC domain-containing protein [Bombardia bombarda]
MRSPFFYRANSTKATTAPLLLSVLLLLLISAPAALAGDDPRLATTSNLTIFADPSSSYAYHGCFNETTDLPGTTGRRALDGGINEVKPGNMTVQMCQAFCKAGGSGGPAYKFAGLEYSRECWCAQQISGLSVQSPDGDCNLPCDGNKTEACGGVLKLSVSLIY